MQTISASVGQGGKNLQPDVITVQELLNRARDRQNLPPIKVDGFVGPQTVGAIRAFQESRFGWADGRVDPGGPTLAALNDVKPEPRGDQVHCKAEDLSGGFTFPAFSNKLSFGESTASSSSSSAPPVAATPKATAILHKTETLAWLTAA